MAFAVADCASLLSLRAAAMPSSANDKLLKPSSNFLSIKLYKFYNVYIK